MFEKAFDELLQAYELIGKLSMGMAPESAK